MGNSILGVLCFAFCWGLNGTLESKVSQAFGSGDFEMCGVWLNRGRAILSAIMVPVAILFSNASTLMKLMGQNAVISDHAGRFATLMIPGVWAMIQFDATKRFCTSQF